MYLNKKCQHLVIEMDFSRVFLFALWLNVDSVFRDRGQGSSSGGFQARYNPQDYSTCSSAFIMKESKKSWKTTWVALQRITSSWIHMYVYA